MQPVHSLRVMVPFWRAVWVQTTAAAEAHLDLEFLLPWVVVIASVVAATASGFATIMVRRTGKGANRAAQQSAEAAQTAAAAAERSSLAAQRSADAAVENAATAAAVARHDQERGRRQELRDRLHWAAELALSPEESRARLGRAHLADLGRIAHQDDTIQGRSTPRCRPSSTRRPRS
jgi:hypothetical protein